MGGARLLFSLLVCLVFSLVGCVLGGAGKGDDQRSSTITSPEHEMNHEGGDSDLIRYLPPPLHQPAAITPPYLLLPVFQHQSVPSVPKELLSPVAGRHVLPSVLSNILIPQGLEPYTRVTPVNNNHGVEVWCGYSKITVRINQALLNFRSSAANFRLGTCVASRAAGSVLYFQYDLNECGSLLTVMKGQLLYANEILYRTESQGAVLRAVPLTLPVQCVYDRFHYSYKIGYVPEFHPRWFRKTMVNKPTFSLAVCDDQWRVLGPNASYVLGEVVYVQLSARVATKDKSVYAEACHVTESEESDSARRVDLISNLGCMTDSKRTGSRSRFVSRRMNVLRFAIDAFAFAEATSERLYLHCTVLVESAAACSTVKSCTYSESERRWAELSGHPSACNCCDSECRAPAVGDSSSQQVVAVSSKPWRFIQNNVLPEASEEPNTMLGSVQLHRLHHPKGAALWEESEESEEETEELEEEVVLGVSEHDNLMSDEDTTEDSNVGENGDEEKDQRGAEEKTREDEETLNRS